MKWSLQWTEKKRNLGLDSVIAFFFFIREKEIKIIYLDTVHVKKPNIMEPEGDENTPLYSLWNTYYWFGLRWWIPREPHTVAHNGSRWIFHVPHGGKPRGGGKLRADIFLWNNAFQQTQAECLQGAHFPYTREQWWFRCGCKEKIRQKN